MMPLPTRPIILTYNDYIDFPDDGKRYEIINGEASMTPAPSTIHQSVSANLEFILIKHVKKKKLGRIFDAPVDVILNRTTVVQPDLVFVAKQRLSMVTERAIEGPPDLVVEILSPTTSQRDQGVKMQAYATFGVRYYWLVDSQAKTLVEHILNPIDLATIKTYRMPEIATTLAFPDLAIDLKEVFDVE